VRFLVLYAHPDADSFDSAAHQAVVQSLNLAGHEVDDCDLYAEAFQPVLSREEHRVYLDPARNQANVAREVERLRNCEGLVFVFPTWSHGMPAILKGYIDRVWLPGVAFTVADGATRPNLQHVKRFAVVTTYGASWWLHTFVFGNPNKKALMRGLRSLAAPGARTLWLAQYAMDRADDAQRSRFLAEVRRRFAGFAR
jgi:NAD(P)H dehydrogenase (quinone)